MRRLPSKLLNRSLRPQAHTEKQHHKIDTFTLSNEQTTRSQQGKQKMGEVETKRGKPKHKSGWAGQGETRPSMHASRQGKQTGQD